jgi:molybdopterin molybdotransferase
MSTLPDYADALQLALRGVKRIERFEEVDIANAGGRVLGDSIVADRDLPPFNRAQMDGYAIRADDFQVGATWRVAGSVPAGTSADAHVATGECVAIATGAPLPHSLDTVIQHELSDRGDRIGHNAVHFTVASIERGHAVHRQGSDAKAGAILIPPGTMIEAQHLGIAAAVGRTSVRVRAKPRAWVLSSGDEVMPPSTPTHDLAPHQIRNSNSVMVMELLRRFGANPVGAEHVRDEREATISALQTAIANVDLVITIGGVSAGDRDHFPTAFEACGIRPVLRGASIQPGRPIQVASNQRVVVAALPGNPVSALACACLFVWPIVRVMSHLTAPLPWRNVTLAEQVKPNANRRAFRPAILKTPTDVVIPSWAGSGDLAHTAATHGLAELPVQAEPVKAGTQLRFLPWP